MNAPTIHLNGTSKEFLLAAAIDAKDAVVKARNALAAVYPNGRDYYPQDSTAGTAPGVSQRIAADQFVDMDHKLRDVITELSDLALAIVDQ
jgi:hypothetical protein